MYLNTHRGDDARLKLVNDISGVFADLGLISADDAETIENHLVQAAEVKAAVGEIEATRGRVAAEQAGKLVGGPLTVDKLTAAALTVPEADAVHNVALNVWRHHVTEAKTLLVANAAELPAVLTARLTSIAEQGLAASDKLSGVTDAQGAIDRGVTEEWSTLTSALNEYSRLVKLIDKLRENLLLAHPSPTDRARWAWRFRTQPRKVVGGGFRTTPMSDADHRALVVEDWRSSPWVPASSEEVQAVVATARESESVAA